MCEALQLNWKLPSTNNNNNVKAKSGGSKKTKESKAYTLRACSVLKRKETEHKKSQPKKRGPKPRPRPLPMSKYRRKTANMRERMRMGEINNAFDALKDKIPSLAVAGKGRCEKMTKINVLHVAINYIRALENILDTGDAGVNVYGTAVVQSPNCENSFSNSCDSEVEPESPVKADCSTSSGSEDSGIMDEDEEDEQQQQCPDWTELTSTLDFPPPNQPSLTTQNPVKLLPPPPTICRGNMDTLLTVSATPTTPPVDAKSAKLARVLQPKFFNRQTSFPDLSPEGDDLFSDLNDSFESLDGFISFTNNDDPFQLPIF